MTDEEKAKNILSVMDVLKDLIERHEQGGFFDLMPYVARIEKIYEDK